MTQGTVTFVKQFGAVWVVYVQVVLRFVCILTSRYQSAKRKKKKQKKNVVLLNRDQCEMFTRSTKDAARILRHVTRTHRVELDRLERMNLGRSFLIKYVRASDQLAGILTKSAFASLLWQSSLKLWQVQQPEDFCDVRSSSLKPVSCAAFCTKKLAQTMTEAERIDIIWDTIFSNKFGFKLHCE